MKSIKCEYCGQKATNETNINGVYVCGDVNCLISLAESECVRQELTEDDHKNYGTE